MLSPTHGINALVEFLTDSNRLETSAILLGLKYS